MQHRYLPYTLPQFTAVTPFNRASPMDLTVGSGDGGVAENIRAEFRSSIYV